MSSEPPIVEIYIDPKTRQILEYVPASGHCLTTDEFGLPENAVFVTQINIDEVLQNE